MKGNIHKHQFALLIPLASILFTLSTQNASALLPHYCFTPDHYTLWVYTDTSGTYIENSNELADGSHNAYITWNYYQDNGLWILMGPDYEHPDLGWRAYLQPDSSSDEWGTCAYAGDGQWSSNPNATLNPWGSSKLDIFPTFSNPGTYQITGTHPGWNCTNGFCGSSVSGGDDSININLFQIEPSVEDLFSTVSGSDLSNDGVYIHFNTDNDNDSNNLPGSNTANLDYTKTWFISQENDLKRLNISLSSFYPPDKGVISLTRLPVPIKVWRSSDKFGGGVLTDDYVKSWDLSIPSERSDFNNVKNNLWVEGCSWGDYTLLITYTQGDNCMFYQTILYHCIAAICGDHTEYAYDPSGRCWPYYLWICDPGANIAPNIVHCEWSKTGDVNPAYNCIAWSVDENDETYDNLEVIDVQYGDKDGVFETSDMLAFYLQKKGWTPITTGTELEKAEQAEAIYFPFASDYDYINDPIPTLGYHAARRKQCFCGAGKWIMYESKLGEWFQIEHVWDQLNGGKYDAGTKIYLR